MTAGPRPLPRLDGVEHRTVAAGGVRLHVATAGGGDPVLLLHGWPQHWWVWRHVIPALARTHHVVAPDLRGLGWSEAPASGYEKEQLAADILALLDVLGIESSHVVGHDWGGWIGQLLAVRAPQRVRSLLALGIPHLWTPRTAALRNLGGFLYQPLAATPMPAALHAALIGRGLRALLPLSGTVTAADIETYVAQFREPERARASARYYRTLLLREVPVLSRRPYADARLEMPVILAVGDRDPVVGAEMRAGVAEHAADARVDVLPGVGHFVPDESPDAVLARFLELAARLR